MERSAQAYKKSVFLVVGSLLIMGCLAFGARWVMAVPGASGLPSSYDPKITVEEASLKSDKPLLIEFYTDACATCQVVTPWIHKLQQKYPDRFTFVMVDVDNPRHQTMADIFGIEYVPAIFVFDKRYMAKAQVNIASYKTMNHLEQGVLSALADVEKKSRAKTAVTGRP